MSYEYEACVYETPAGCAEEAGPRDLTRIELTEMNLEGLPVRVEHGERARVGTVVAKHTCARTGRTDVRYRLDDSVAGISADELTRAGRLAQVSLKHLVHPGGRKEPVEVSLCIRGARPNTDIRSTRTAPSGESKYKRDTALSENDHPYSAVNIHTKHIPTMPEETAAAVPEAANPVADPPLADAHATAEPATEPTKKRTRDQAVGDIADGIGDPELKKAFFDMAGDFLQEIVETRDAASKEMTRLNDENTVLNKQVNLSKENTDSLARQVTAVMNDLYSKFVPHAVLPADQAEQFTNALAQSPDMLKAMQPVAVLASAVATATGAQAHAQAAMANTELHESQAKVKLLTQQYRNLGNGGHETHHMWTAPPVAAPPPLSAPPPVAAAIAVEASAGAISAIPSWLQGRLCAYDTGASAASKVFSGDFQNGGPRK